MSKKSQILDTALTLFIEHGFEKTPTSLISQTSGVATGTLFHHFKTKEELINALYLSIKLTVAEVLDHGRDPEASLKQQLHVFWHDLVSWFLEHPREYRFMVQFSQSAAITDSTHEKASEAFDRLTQLFQQGRAEETFYDFPEELFKALLSSHLFSTCDYFLTHPKKWQSGHLKEDVFLSFWRQLAKVDY